MNLNFLKNLLLKGSLTVTGDVSGTGLRTSFNQGSATGDNSFAVGLGAALGEYSHAEGIETIASGRYSHAEGDLTIASGDASHAEGAGSVASGYRSHAEGRYSEAKGSTSHAAGYGATAGHNYSYVWSDGELGTREPNLSSTREGQYVIDATGGVYIPRNVGIGTDSIDNALTVVGTISTSNHGNSNLWNSTYTTFTNNSANYILNGGNSKESNLLIGTNDNYSLNLETAGTTKVTITSGGEVNVGGVTDAGGLRVFGLAAQNNSVTNTGKFVYGGFFSQPYPDSSRSIGLYTDAYGSNSTTGYIAGLEGRAWVTGSSGTIPLAYGLTYQAVHYGTGITVTDLRGVNIQSKFYNLFSTGTINNAYGIYGIVGDVLTAGQTVTNSYGLRLDIGASTNAYGVYIPTFNTAPTGTNNWGLWIQGGANNYIQGNLGVGTGSGIPNEKLTISGNVSASGSGTFTNLSASGNITAPNQTASAGSSVLTRNLTDARYFPWSPAAHCFGSIGGVNTALGPFMMVSRADTSFSFFWGTNNSPAYGLPFFCNNGKSLSTVRINHTAGTNSNASATLEVGLYAANSSGLPDTFIDKVAFSLSATGSKTATLAAPYTPTGLFWALVRPVSGDTDFKDVTKGGNGTSLAVMGYGNGYNSWAAQFFGFGVDNSGPTQYHGSLMPRRAFNSTLLPTSSVLSEIEIVQTANGSSPCVVLY